MELSQFDSSILNELQMKIAANALLINRGRILMRIVSETGPKGMSPTGLINVANIFADGSVVTGAWFLQEVN